MSTVRGLRYSSRAISRLVRPTATSRTTSSSLRDSPDPSASASARRPSRGGDRLAEDRDLARRLHRQEARPQPARVPVRLVQTLQRGVALARGRERDARPHADLHAVDRDLQRPVDVERPPHLLGGAGRVVLGERDLAHRVGEAGEDVGVPGARGDRGEGLGAAVGAVQVAAPARNRADQRSPRTA